MFLEEWSTEGFVEWMGTLFVGWIVESFSFFCFFFFFFIQQVKGGRRRKIES